MEARELLRRIATFPLRSNTLAADMLAGGYRSVYQGQGIEFDQVRRYERGDDIRSIDWNVSARFGKPFVKLYREERELTVCLALDVSPSMFSGAGGNETLTRFDQAALAAALVAFSTERAGQRLGALLFDRAVRAVFPPRKGRPHTMAVIGGIIHRDRSAARAGPGSALGAALAGVGRLLKRRGMVVIISDFYCAGWEAELGDLCHNHDCVAIRITDPQDTRMADFGLATLEDPETGVHLLAPPRFASFRSAWVHWHQERAQHWEAACRRSGARTLSLSTAEDAAASLSRFFRSRG
jgi:uncharacterized protein (DUF58 family)